MLKSGCVEKAPCARTSFGSVAFGAPQAGVERPTVLGAARLRALGLSTPARPYGSLSAGGVGTGQLGGPSTELVCERSPSCPAADLFCRYSRRLFGYGSGGTAQVWSHYDPVGQAEQA